LRSRVRRLCCQPGASHIKLALSKALTIQESMRHYDAVVVRDGKSEAQVHGEIVRNLRMLADAISVRLRART
jgi:hypothetical protein